MTTIDERKLDRLQAAARWAAVAVLVVFVALIGYSAHRLRGIQREIRQSTRLLDERKAELETMEARKAELEKAVAELEVARDALEEIASRVAEQNPGIVREATREVIAARPERALQLPRVYPHIRYQAQRPAARRIGVRLEKADFLVPGIEFVGEDSPRRTQLRQFFDNDVATKDVQRILEILAAAGVSAEVNLIRDSPESIRDRHYELWLGDDFRPFD